MARAGDFISSLINVALSQDVLFHQRQQLQCLHHGATFVPLYALILSSQSRKVTLMLLTTLTFNAFCYLSWMLLCR